MKKIILDFLDKGYPANGSFVEYVGRDIYDSFTNLCKSLYGAKKTILHGIEILHIGNSHTSVSAGIVWNGRELVSILATSLAGIFYDSDLKFVFSENPTSHAYRDGTSRNTYIEKKGEVTSGASEGDPERISLYHRTKPIDEVVTAEFDNYEEHISTGVPHVRGRKTIHRDGLIVIDGFISGTELFSSPRDRYVRVNVIDLNLAPRCPMGRIDIGNAFLTLNEVFKEECLLIKLKSWQHMMVDNQRLEVFLSDAPVGEEFSFSIQFKMIIDKNNMSRIDTYEVFHE